MSPKVPSRLSGFVRDLLLPKRTTNFVTNEEDGPFPAPPLFKLSFDELCTNYWSKRKNQKKRITSESAIRGTNITIPVTMFALTNSLVAPALKRPKAAKAVKRGSLQVVAHGGVGGSGGTQYAGKDKAHGSDQAPWKKKLVTHDPDQADPDANSGRGGGWNPPPPTQESFAASPAAPSGGGGWDAPAPSSGGSSWDAPAPASSGSSWDTPAPSSGGGSSWDAPAPSSGGGGGGDPWANQGAAAPKANVGQSINGGAAGGGQGSGAKRQQGIMFDPDQYDPNP